jgi:hypothetical protein
LGDSRTTKRSSAAHRKFSDVLVLSNRTAPPDGSEQSDATEWGILDPD